MSTDDDLYDGQDGSDLGHYRSQDPAQFQYNTEKPGYDRGGVLEGVMDLGNGYIAGVDIAAPGSSGLSFVCVRDRRGNHVVSQTMDLGGMTTEQVSVTVAEWWLQYQIERDTYKWFSDCAKDREAYDHDNGSLRSPWSDADDLDQEIADANSWIGVLTAVIVTLVITLSLVTALWWFGVIGS